MKNLKLILILFVAISLNSCSDNGANEPSYILSNENIAGTYNFSSLVLDTTISTTTNGVTFDVGTRNDVGDTFQVNFDLTANGTFTILGALRIVSVTRFVSGDKIDETKIVNIDGSGNYTIDTVENTITFSGDNEYIKGTLNFEVFNETTFVLSQAETVKEGSNTLDILTKMTLVRK